MAQLGPCICCKRKVSDEAENCPSCGQPTPFDYSQLSLAELRGCGPANRILVIKKIRERTGWDIQQAKAFLDGGRN